MQSSLKPRSSSVSFQMADPAAMAGSIQGGAINMLQAAGGDINKVDARTRSELLRLAPATLNKYLRTPVTETAAPATGGSGTPGGNIDANSLLELYQKGLGAGEAKGASTDDQIRLLREGNNLDLQRKRAEQDMQMEGQKQALSQTQEARAKERETEAQLQRRQQSTERSNAMAAFKSL